jgi:hypothetical protein
MKFKKSFVGLILIFLMLPEAALKGQSEEIVIKNNLRDIDSKYVEFLGYDNDFRSPKPYIVDQNGEALPRPDAEWINEEMEKWRSIILLGLNFLLPNSFLDNLVVRNNMPIKFLFYIDRRAWNSGLVVLENNVICINLWPSWKRPEWMTWGEVIKDETISPTFSRAERLAFIFHEIGHVYSPGGEEFDIFYSNGSGENVPTLYAQQFGKREDFADSFMLYAMWREVLYEKNKERYDIIRNILGVEFPSAYEMPVSIKVRLTVIPKREKK